MAALSKLLWRRAWGSCRRRQQIELCQGRPQSGAILTTPLAGRTSYRPGDKRSARQGLDHKRNVKEQPRNTCKRQHPTSLGKTSDGHAGEQNPSEREGGCRKVVHERCRRNAKLPDATIAPRGRSCLCPARHRRRGAGALLADMRKSGIETAHD